MFVSTAYAQTAGGAAGGDMLVQFAPLILIFVVFYFLLIRPQQKKMKEHKAMLESIRRGDRVVTGGGIIGTVTKVGPEEELQVEIADGVKVRCLRGTVNMVLARTEPAKGEKAAAATTTTVTPAEEETAAAPAPADKAEEGKGIGKLFGRK